MHDARTKIGFVVALLFVAGSALFWNSIYRSAADRVAEVRHSDRLLLVVNGGVALPASRPSTPPAPAPRAKPRPSPRPAPRTGPVAPPKAPGTFEVRKGDSLYRIADEVLGSAERWPELARLNDIPPPYRLRPGQHLTLPPGVKHR